MRDSGGAADRSATRLEVFEDERGHGRSGHRRQPFEETPPETRVFRRGVDPLDQLQSQGFEAHGTAPRPTARARQPRIRTLPERGCGRALYTPRRKRMKETCVTSSPQG